MNRYLNEPYYYLRIGNAQMPSCNDYHWTKDGTWRMGREHVKIFMSVGSAERAKRIARKRSPKTYANATIHISKVCWGSRV